MNNEKTLKPNTMCKVNWKDEIVRVFVVYVCVCVFFFVFFFHDVFSSITTKPVNGNSKCGIHDVKVYNFTCHTSLLNCVSCVDSLFTWYA